MNNIANDDSDPSVGIRAWLTARLPEEWTGEGPAITVDREEITVVVSLPGSPQAAELGEAERSQAASGAAARFREQTREQRVRIAREAEHRFGRKVAWGVAVGTHHELFTHLAVPVMARLRQPERLVLDTLVDAGVARSRADAVAWSVRLVGRNTEQWLAELRSAMEQVQRVRAAGPQ